MKPLDSTAHGRRPGRGRLRSLAARGLAGLLAAIVALPLQAQAETAPTALMKVTDVSVTPGDKQLVVTWPAVATATGYTVQWWPAESSGDISTKTVPGTSLTISGLTNDADYKVRVHAIGTDAIGAWSAEMTGKSEGARG